MAVLAQTVGDIVDSVAFHLTNNTTIDTTFDNEIKKALGWILFDLVAKSDLPAFRTEAQLTLVDGTSDYALPADFERVIEPSVYYDTSPRELISYYEEQDRIANEWPEWLSTEDKPLRYTVRNRASDTGLYQMRFIPTPDTTYTVNYSYYASPSRVNEDTADGTEIDLRFPRNLMSGLIAGTCLCFPQYLTPDQQERYERKYRETMEDIRRKSDPIVGYARQQKRYRATDYRGPNRSWSSTIYTGDPLR